MSKDKSKFIRMVGKYTVKIIPPRCIAAASCVAISPDVFKLNEDNLAEIVENPQDGEENILLAAKSCPTAAIEIWEGDKKVWPE